MKRYNWELIIYDYKKLEYIMEICNNNQIDYCFILHNKDMEKGHLKKSHIHFLVFFTYQHTLTSVSKIFDIPLMNIQKVDNKVGAIRYLIHLDHKDKYQYDMDDIISTFDISSYFNQKIDKSMQEGLQVLQIIDYINSNNYSNITDIVRYCVNNGLYSSFRRNQNILLRLYYDNRKE